jgi:2'-5' RNA ligase
MSSAKYFIAIVIPPPFFEEIESIKHELKVDQGLKGALRSPAHITLHRPFEWPAEKENQLVDKLSGFSFSHEFDISLKGFGFFEPRVIFVNVVYSDPLFMIHDELKRYAATELRIFNERDDRRGFHPHVTVAFRDLKKREFPAVSEKFRTRAYNACFSYAGFSLLRLSDKWKVLRDFSR